MGYRTNVKMVQRLTYRRRLSYNTASNQRRIVRTPGGKLTYQYKKKPRQIPKCGMCKTTLRGIRPLAPMKGSACLLDRRKYTALMEVACATTACGKRLRAFLIEEQKIVAKVLKAQQA